VKYILDGEEGQITVRHLFYRLVGHGVIPKTEAANPRNVDASKHPVIA